jgi:hypothetical protein
MKHVNNISTVLELYEPENIMPCVGNLTEQKCI